MSDKLKYRCCWVTFICVQVFLFVLMSATYVFEPWVYTDNDKVLVNYNWSDEDNNVYNGSDFVGNLFVCRDSCNSWYKRLSYKWCDFYSDLKDFASEKNIDESLADPWKSVCLLYTSLYFGMLTYIVLEALGMICLLFWICLTIIYIKKQKFLICGFIFAILAWIFHCAAFLGYVGITKTGYDQKCDDFPDNGDGPVLCASSGLAYVLAVAAFMLVFVVFYLITACVLSRANSNYERADDSPIKRVNDEDQVDLNGQDLKNKDLISPKTSDRKNKV